MGILIEFNNVSFAYDEKAEPLIHQFSLEVNSGDQIAIKGDSGSGKTTLFRLLLGFMQPGNGAITFRNEKLAPIMIRKLRRSTAWLPQDLDLGHDSLQDVFYYPFKFEVNTAQKPQEDMVLSVMQSLGLSRDLWDTDFGDLSTGQRQRAGIALCHLLDKPLVLLDEPTSALDEESKQRVVDLLFDVKDRTILSTSHDPWWIQRCDKVAKLNT